MNRRALPIIICMILLLSFMLPKISSSKTKDNFGMNWQFAVDLPQAGISGTLKGYLEHIRDTEFLFSGEYINKTGPLESGPINIKSKLKLNESSVSVNDLSIRISRLGIELPEFYLNKPDIVVKGNGELDVRSGSARFDKLTVKAGELPLLETSLSYSPTDKGRCSLAVHNPLPLFEKLAANFLTDFNQWDKEGNFKLQLSLNRINSNPEAKLELNFEQLSAASPDGLILLDSVTGMIGSSFPIGSRILNVKTELNTGEALLDTFYINLAEHPLTAALRTTIPTDRGNISSTAAIDWRGIASAKIKTDIADAFNSPKYAGEGILDISELSTPFKLFFADPFSVEHLKAGGELSLDLQFNGTAQRSYLTGMVDMRNGSFSSGAVGFNKIDAALPFAIALKDHFIPHEDENLEQPAPGIVEFGNIEAGPIKIQDFRFPLTVSSNMVEFGKIPLINLEGGTVRLSDLYVRNPFSENFVLHGGIKAKNINMLAMSPKALPIDGRIAGDLEFWLLREHFSTTGSLFGEVYGGQMTISEIYAENLFEPSRQFGADFSVKNLDLEPLSKALDIGRITGRMDLDLTNLVIAYDQPAAFKLHAETTPGSGSAGEISLKAVNTLSVIGTGSGLTGAGVGAFSQFFKEFGYAGLGMECTLDDDIFKIRGLIREDGIEYIIKRPPLFGINVINSNPENLISFSDMLKRLKRVIGN